MAASNSFATKQLRVTFKLSTGAVFQGTNANTLVLAGLRTSVVVRGLGFPAWPDAELAIYGMKQADMNALASLAFQLEQVNRNYVQVDANSGNGWGTVFAGQIVNAAPDYSQRPEVCLRVQARVLYDASLQATPAVSYTGSTDVAAIISTLATQAGFAFENNGVTAQLSNPYLAGTLGDQIKKVAADAGIDAYIEGFGAEVGNANRGVIAICPKGKPRNTQPFVLTPDSGLVGYPIPEARGYISVRALYNPAFRFGGPITIKGSTVVIDGKALNTRADGNWFIGNIQNTLEAVKFDGAWFSDMLLQPIGTQPVQ